MVNYRNAFSFSANKNADEYILYFKQQTPILDQQGTITGANDDLVAGIVVNRSGALALHNLLEQMMAASDNETP